MKDTLLSRGMRFGLPEVPAFKGEILAPGSYVWGDMECRAIHAPGHSAGSLCFYIPKEKALLAGDVLFYRSVGRSDFPGGDADTLCRTLRERIYTLPSDTVVYPGHGPVTTVGDEAAHNPLLQHMNGFSSSGRHTLVLSCSPRKAGNSDSAAELVGGEFAARRPGAFPLRPQALRHRYPGLYGMRLLCRPSRQVFNGRTG